jgi:hypothetical protein
MRAGNPVIVPVEENSMRGCDIIGVLSGMGPASGLIEPNTSAATDDKHSKTLITANIEIPSPLDPYNAINATPVDLIVDSLDRDADIDVDFFDTSFGIKVTRSDISEEAVGQQSTARQGRRQTYHSGLYRIIADLRRSEPGTGGVNRDKPTNRQLKYTNTLTRKGI